MAHESKCLPDPCYSSILLSSFLQFFFQLPSRQTRLGKDPVSPQTRRKITEEREFALHEYRVNRPCAQELKAQRASCRSIWWSEGALQPISLLLDLLAIPAVTGTRGGILILSSHKAEGDLAARTSPSPSYVVDTALAILQPLYGNTFTMGGPQLGQPGRLFRSVHLDSSRGVVKAVICLFIPAAVMLPPKAFQASLPPSVDAIIKSDSIWSSHCDKVLFVLLD